MFGPLIFIRGSRLQSPEARTQAAFNQLVREIRVGERELAKADRLLRRRPWKRFEISYHLGRGMLSEYQLERLSRRTGDPMFSRAHPPMRELNEALEYAQVAVDEGVLEAARIDTERARAALKEVRQAIESAMTLRFTRWGRHLPFDEPSTPLDYDTLFPQLRAVTEE